ncbi:hypothetical protein C5167_038901 [Papaver somniferum]|uniref:Transmembrane protein n=1 Tax=Papaver somniferum TaxID=3469 RepID=A0A4Y7IE34_PAPSO|nr:hypothetical protein C5167_038901 [Papaver somniferum]
MVIFSTLLRPYGSDSQPYESKPNHAPFRSKMVTTAMLRYEMNRRLGNRHCFFSCALILSLKLEFHNQTELLKEYRKSGERHGNMTTNNKMISREDDFVVVVLLMMVTTMALCPHLCPFEFKKRR